MEIPAILSGLPDAMIVFILAATPMGELRLSIPVGIGLLGMSAYSTFLWSVLGNLIPIILVYAFGDLWMHLVERRRGFWHRLTDVVLHRSRHAFKDGYKKYGLIALTIFVAIPLPLTGAWTGALAAYVFGIPFRLAFPFIGLGVIGAGLIVLAAVTGVISAFSFFL